jgi:hypothetical protein
MTHTQEASKKLGKSLKKIIRLALMGYCKQSAFYRKCNSPHKHVNAIIYQFFLGFCAEVKAERKAAEVRVVKPIQNTQKQPSLVLQY